MLRAKSTKKGKGETVNLAPLTLAEARKKAANLSAAQEEHQRERVKSAEALAKAESEYRRLKAREILRLHADGVAWSACEDLARGTEAVADARFRRDLARGTAAAVNDNAYRLAADRHSLDNIVRWSMQLDMYALSHTGGETEPQPKTVTSDEVRRVFTEWVEATGRSKRTLCDNARKGLIRQALSQYPYEDVRDAVRGWRYSPHHRGENDQRVKYNDLSLLLRDSAHIERFRDLERRKPHAVADQEAGDAERLRVKYDAR